MISKSNKDLLFTFARLLLGGLFVYMGLNKALHPEVFLKLVHAYHVVGSSLLLNLIAALLPWLEVLCGLLLLMGIAVQGTGLVLSSMLIPFTILVAWRGAIIAAQTGIGFCAVKFDCGCGSGEVLVCYKILENCLLTGLAIALTLGNGGHLSLWYAAVPEQSAKRQIPS